MGVAVALQTDGSCHEDYLLCCSMGRDHSPTLWPEAHAATTEQTGLPRLLPSHCGFIFMVTPTAPVRLHRIRNDQLYHYYLGDPIEVLLLHGGGTTERVVVGPDLRGGERVQLLIPGNTFHAARLMGRRRWFLGASTECQESCPPTSRSATSRSWRRNTRMLPPTCARSRTPFERIEGRRLRAKAAHPSFVLARLSIRGSASAASRR